MNIEDDELVGLVLLKRIPTRNRGKKFRVSVGRYYPIIKHCKEDHQITIQDNNGVKLQFLHFDNKIGGFYNEFFQCHYKENGKYCNDIYKGEVK